MRYGEFTLSSGQKSSFYVDLRVLSMDYRASALIGDLLLMEVLRFENVFAVGGLTMGADPLANAVMHRSIINNTPIHAFCVRKAPKLHGTSKHIEGPDLAGRGVLILEDTSTTGNSPLFAASRAEDAGARVLGICTIVDRDTGAKEAIHARGYTYTSIYTKEDLCLDAASYAQADPQIQGPTR